ncbi:MAG: hypothetical protein ACR2LX_03485 [Jatrophihabitans sp.]
MAVPDVAARLAAVLGRPVPTIDVPLDDYRQTLLARGFEPGFVDTPLPARG